MILSEKVIERLQSDKEALLKHVLQKEEDDSLTPSYFINMALNNTPHPYLYIAPKRSESNLPYTDVNFRAVK